MPVRFLRYRMALKSRAQTLRRDATPAERKLWYEFLRDLPQKFTRQKPLARFIVDFYCAEHALVVEVDGDSHFPEEANGYEAARTAALERLGLRVLRFTNEDVMQRFEAVCAAIAGAISKSSR